MRRNFFIISVGLLVSCANPNTNEPVTAPLVDSDFTAHQDTIRAAPPKTIVFSGAAKQIYTGTTTPEELLAFAQTLIGIPYQYGSVDPAVGFDCSGFITHVFNHFNIAVPRSTIDFTYLEREIDLEQCKPGDIVLFTGTEIDSADRKVGHMGIITANENGQQYFIHSTSGKAYGVTISLLSPHYVARFVKVLRIFPQNDQ